MPTPLESELAGQIWELTKENVRFRLALEDIDAVAVGKKSGSAAAMQAIARKALAVPNGDRGSAA